MPTLTGKEVGPIGYGLMGLTWRADPPSQETSFKAMRTSLEQGANAWNGGEIYGNKDRNSLHLLNEYFTKYPEDAEKVVLSIKGGMPPNEMRPDGSEKNVKRSIDECLSVLEGKKFLDLFECARVDPKTPIEITVRTIDSYVKDGKVGGISLSECSANTIHRAAKVAKVAAVEVEFSLWSTDILENGVAKACAEHDIPVIAYSPLGRGFLTGQIKSLDDIPKNSMLRHMPRFQPDAFDKNLDLVKEVEQLASKKGCMPGQIAVAWVLKQSGSKGMPVLIPIPGASSEGRVKENSVKVDLSDADMKEIDGILKSATVHGSRYGGPQAALSFGDSPELKE